MNFIFFFQTEAVVSSGRVEKSPHEQEIKFFAKVRRLIVQTELDFHVFELFVICLVFIDPFAISKPVL